MYYLSGAFIISFIIALISIPSIIGVAKIKNLYDDANHRSSHKGSVPTLGGVAVFAGLMIALAIVSPAEAFGNLQYILAALLIIFFIGIKDDILVIAPMKKMMGQLLAACLVVIYGGVRITSFDGLFGLGEIGPLSQIPLTIFAIVVINNAVNLIDGINGLCAGIGIIVFSIFATWFYLVGDMSMAILSIAMVGALLAFLKYNVTPSKIFLGDTGSLIIGFLSAVAAIKFIESGPASIAGNIVETTPVVAIGILMIPLFDTIRVFSIRLSQKRSPFDADKNHLHHKLIGMGLSHEVSAMILTTVNVLFAAMVFSLNWMDQNLLLGIEIVAASGLSFLLSYICKLHEAKQIDTARSRAFK